MDEMIRYIFGSLRNSETALKFIAKRLRHQSSFNRTVSWFAVLMTIDALVQDMHIRSLYQKIDILQKEIKELKNTEGD